MFEELSLSVAAIYCFCSNKNAIVLEISRAVYR